MIKILLLIIFSSFNTACVTYKSIGGYDVYGIVIDSITKDPIEDVTVSLRFYAVDFYGNNSIDNGKATTDEDGKFLIEVPKTKLRGGVGGLSGSAKEWPEVNYTKLGYCITGRGFGDATLKDYQDIILELTPKNSKEGSYCK